MNRQAKKGVEIDLQQVVRIMSNQNDRFRQIIEVIEQERTAISKMDVSAIIGHTNTKEAMLTVILDLDNELQAVLENLGEGSKRGLARLRALDPYFPGPAQKRFKALREEWGGLREEVLGGNVVNRRVVKETLAFLGDAIGLFTGADRVKNAGYEAAGRQGRAVVGPCLISREV